MPKSKVFRPTEEMLAIATSRILGIAQRYNGIPNTETEPAATFIRRRMFRKCDIGSRRAQQNIVIEMTLDRLVKEQLLEAGKSRLKIGLAQPPSGARRKSQKYDRAGRLGTNSGRRRPAENRSARTVKRAA